MTKSFLTQNQQVDLLIARGLSINDREIAIQKLQSINYYRFNAYFHQFLKDNTFIRGTTFDNILSAYLRRTGYCDALFLSILKQFSRDKKDPIAEHYYANHDGQFEVWVIVEYLSFGDLSRLFSISNNEIQNVVAKSFNVHETLLKGWLQSLSILRNICAHYGYLRKREFSIAPAIPRSLIQQVGSNRQLFSLLIALSWLIDKNQKMQLVEALRTMDDDWSFYGFIDNWENVLLS